MSKGLEKIVASLELCKKIPEGEFEDSALVWVYEDVVEFLCRTSGCEQIHKKEWQRLEYNHPRKIAIRRKCGKEIYPAPTLEETITSLLTYGWLVKIDCRIQLDTLIEFYSEKQSKTEFGNTASETALRLWFKVKGIEVE